MSPSGLIYGIAPSQSTYAADKLYLIDPSLGVGYSNIPASSVSSLKDTSGNILLQSITSLAFSSNNQLYAIGTSATGIGTFYQININTSVATALATLPTGFNYSGDLVYDGANNRFLATSADTGAHDALWQIPLSNPAGVTRVGSIASSNVDYLDVKGLAFENGQLTGYTAHNAYPYGSDKITINASTGAVTAVQNLPNISSVRGAATIVPLTTPVRTDFNGDKKSDILWRNTDGSVALWQMTGSNVATGTVFDSVPTNWTIQQNSHWFSTNHLVDLWDWRFQW
jgi:hypothetical protein